MQYNKISAEDINKLHSFISDGERFITKPTPHWDHDHLKL